MSPDSIRARYQSAAWVVSWEAETPCLRASSPKVSKVAPSVPSPLPFAIARHRSRHYDTYAGALPYGTYGTYGDDGYDAQPAYPAYRARGASGYGAYALPSTGFDGYVSDYGQ